MLPAPARPLQHGAKGSAVKVTVDTTLWTRWREVVQYSERRGIGLGDAIHELVNTGLSHQLQEEQS